MWGGGAGRHGNRKSTMIILHVGDVVGKPGRKTVRRFMPELIDEYQPDLIIINGENVAGGIGITASTAGELMAAGAGCITTGNHVWAQKPALQLLDEDHDILRPANYPPGPGNHPLALVGLSRSAACCWAVPWEASPPPRRSWCCRRCCSDHTALTPC